jgi:anti-sigma factor RsiW
MADPRDHVDEALQELLDGRLGPAERAAIEAHLAGCPRCRRLRLSLEASRAALRAALPGEEGPAEPLRARVLAALDAEDRAQGASAAPPRVGARRRRLAWSLAAAATVAVGALLFLWLGPWGRERFDPVREIEAEFRRLGAGEPALELAATAPDELERRFAASGLPFRPRVLDLQMMGFALDGGRIGRVGAEPSAIMVYRGADRDDLLVCTMYRGRLADLPAADQVTRRGDFVFHVFRRGATTLVFWQEGELVCVLASRGDPAALLDLAAAKAMLAPGTRQSS